MTKLYICQDNILNLYWIFVRRLKVYLKSKWQVHEPITEHSDTLSKTKAFFCHW